MMYRIFTMKRVCFKSMQSLIVTTTITIIHSVGTLSLITMRVQSSTTQGIYLSITIASSRQLSGMVYPLALGSSSSKLSLVPVDNNLMHELQYSSRDHLEVLVRVRISRKAKGRRMISWVEMVMPMMTTMMMIIVKWITLRIYRIFKKKGMDFIRYLRRDYWMESKTMKLFKVRRKSVIS